MEVLNWSIAILVMTLGFVAVGHILLNKNDPRSAWGWIFLCLFFPLLGPLIYFVFGINRVRERARKLGIRSPFRLDEGFGRFPEDNKNILRGLNVPPAFQDIAKISDAVTRLPLLSGNRIEILHNGEEAFPAMLKAIRSAQHSLFFLTYIFETNKSGKKFIDALVEAKNRGVDVRVLIDGVGELYSIPRAGTLLKKYGVNTARFIPPKIKPPEFSINLRNHRKLLIADGRVGFTGGMNIGDRHLADNLQNPDRVVDMHFMVMGPVVSQMEKAFLDDWGFATGNYTEPTSGPHEKEGSAICRTIIDGPNEDPEKLTFIMTAAVSSARKSILIMTPYFLPSREIISALQISALRGVEVAVVLPRKNNLPFMTWAASNFLWKLTQWGVKIFFQPPPFVHSKLIVVDDYYTQIGSANIDPRSLRLNFELNIEIFDTTLAKSVASHIRKCIKRSEELTLMDLERRNFAIKLRDAFAWIFSPYL
ncbi:MAG: cardiolipin synthase [Desulfobacterales bacterium]